MTTNEDDASPLEDEDDSLLDDQPIDEDMPCIRCSYNLRGLKPEGQCPECGARIDATLRYVMQEVLCQVCLRPNHPTAATCAYCKSPTTGASATAAYWRPTATSGGRKHRPEDDEDEPDPPSPAWMVMCWLVGSMILLLLATKYWQMWTDAPGPLDTPGMVLGRRIVVGILCLALSMAPLLFIYFATLGYLRSRREYLAKRAGFLAKEETAMKNDVPERKDE